MIEGDSIGPARRRRSLLAFSRDSVEDAGIAPQRRTGDVGRPSSFDDAPGRHRLARSRRDARPNPLLGALAAGDARRQPEPHSADPETAMSPPQAAPPSETVRREPMAGRLRRLVHGLLRSDSANPPPRGRDDASGPTMEIDRVVVETPAVYLREGGGDASAMSSGGNEFWTPLIDPVKVIGAVADAKRLILAATLAGALIGVAVALSTPKKYEAITELLVDPRELKLSNLDLTEPGLPSDATLAIVENQVRVLTSGTVLAKVVERLKLDADPEFNGSRRSFGLRALIGELRGLLSRSGSGASDGLRHTLAIENLAGNVEVERGGKTFVVTIGVKSESPDKSALIANTMADVFLETYGQLQAQTAGRAADELSARLDELRREVEAAERQIAEFKAQNEIIDPQGRLITDDELVKLNDQLAVARAHTLELNARAASVRDVNVDSVLGGATPEGVTSGVITELRAQYATLKAETDRMAARLGPRHPERIAAEAQLASAREQIAAELRRIAAAVQMDLKRAVELEQQLAQRLAQLKVRHGDVSGDLVRLRELEREAATRRAVYESSLLRARQTGEQRDINTANITVISKAYPPLEPTGPSRALISAFGMVLGFASGVGLAAMRGAYESLRDRRRRHDPGGRHERGGTDAPVPPPGGPAGGGAKERERSTAPRARAEDRSTQPPAAEETPMPSHAAAPYYPIAQHPMPAQSWVPPAAPMPPVAAYPAAQYAHPYAEPAPYLYPQQTATYAAQPYAPPPAQPVYAQPAPVTYPMAPQPAPTYWQQPAPPPYGMPMHPQHAPAYQSYASYAPPQSAPIYGGYPSAAQAVPFPARQQPAAVEEEAASRAIAEIRASLAEFRDAVRDFTEQRQKRRFL